jgi:hypothetical protein
LCFFEDKELGLAAWSDYNQIVESGNGNDLTEFCKLREAIEEGIYGVQHYRGEEAPPVSEPLGSK